MESNKEWLRIEPLLTTYFIENKGAHCGFKVIPVPFIYLISKVKERGFDQSYLISREVAKAAGLPLNADQLVRLRKTEIQAGLSRGGRLKNVRGVFKIIRLETLKGKDIILMDDVIITGAAVNEVMRVLKKANLDRVFVFTLARA
ncbi:MAG: hypothetical protein VYC17_05235 [Nitrospinota bacterium]|nr:hypothetical protein [Nitrospinota bacterium]